jgi:hypothetical protein
MTVGKLFITLTKRSPLATRSACEGSALIRAIAADFMGAHPATPQRGDFVVVYFMADAPLSSLSRHQLAIASTKGGETMNPHGTRYVPESLFIHLRSNAQMVLHSVGNLALTLTCCGRRYSGGTAHESHMVPRAACGLCPQAPNALYSCEHEYHHGSLVRESMVESEQIRRVAFYHGHRH